MLKEQMNKLKEMFFKKGEKSEGNNKRKIENLVVFVVILIITIILINSIWTKDDNKKEELKTNTDKILAQKLEINEKYQDGNEESNLEQKLENILGKIEGVGRVKVLLTYSQTSQTQAMYNEDSTKSDTEETDKSGGSRKTTQASSKKEVIYKEVDGEKIPVTQSIVKPKIEGAIVTADGAENIDIKTNIMQAVEAATGLATHKIQVFEMANN